MSWELLIGAGTTLLGVVVGGVLTRRHAQRQWLKDTQMTSCVAVLREYTRIEFDIRLAYLEDRAPKVDWAPWGATLAALTLVFDDRLLGQAQRLSDRLAELERFVHGGERDEAAWRGAQQRVVEAQIAFVNAGRRELDAALPTVGVRLGGPLLD